MRLTELIEKLVAIESKIAEPMATVEMVDENGVRSEFSVRTEVVFAAKQPITVLLIAVGDDE
jgi:hypothetical protein